MEKMLKRIISEDVELRMKLDPGIGALTADPVQIDQIIMNLTVNARDAMRSGGVLTFVTSSLGLKTRDEGKNLEPGAYAVLTVKDTGCGMDQATMAHIFEPFFSTKEVGKGTGLGLSTVYGIMQQLGGSISVASEPGCGTTFTLYFRTTTHTVASQTIASPERETRGSETIMLVEDDDLLRQLAKGVLERAGYLVYAASGVEEAERILHEISGPIHLMITDVVMADGGGMALVSKLMKTRPTTKVLLVSGYTDGKVPPEYLAGDRPFFLAKPFDPDQLAKKVRQVLDRQAAMTMQPR